jgi:hypothetical protein
MPHEAPMTEAATPTAGQALEANTAPAADAKAAAPEANVQQQAPDVKATDAAPAATDTKPEGEKAAPEGAPEKYEFKEVEGQKLDESVIGAFSEVAKELNLTQDAAQKVVDKMGPAMALRQKAAMEAASKEWAEQARADKEFGGANLDANLGIAKKALDAFGSPELATLLNESGLGNHPDVVRAFYRVGKAISEDRLVTGNASPTTAAKDHASRLYPNQA